MQERNKKLIAVSVDEWEKEHFRMEVAKLYTKGLTDTPTESKFIRDAINKHLKSFGIKFQI